MRLIAFLSDPLFSPPTLERLAESHHTLTALVTTPDVPRGRSGKPTPCIPAQMAEQLGLPVLKPHKLSETFFLESLKLFGADAAVVAAYPKFLPMPILDLPPYGCWNIHPSLLPRWRGAAPVQRALMAGDALTGVSIMRMVEKMDAGSILLQQTTPIGDDEDGESLLRRLAILGADMMLACLEIIETGAFKLTEQDESRVTMAPKLKEEEALLDWEQPSRVVWNRIRGLRPSMIAHSFWRGKRLQVLRARPLEKLQPMAVPTPATLIFTGKILGVACQDGIIELISVRLEGKNAVSGAEFARGAHLEPNEQLGYGSRRNLK